MRRLILAALAVAASIAAAPPAANAQDVQAQRRAELRQQRQQRLTEMRQQQAERREERLRQLAERRPELKQRIDQRIAEGKKVRPVARGLRVQRRMKTIRPEMFDRLDLNKDGVLSRDEWRPRVRRKV
jgi:Ni/Co efflux regulator RcnB